jgi:phage terminase large subunit GpA-like protein
MDAVSNPLVERVVFMKPAQVGGTEIILNIVGFYAHHDPSPILVIQPTLEIALAFSKDRLAPMVRDTKPLFELVSDVKAKDKGNTLLHKTFPGGHITLAGANSPASLAMRPIRVTLFDEIDRYPASAGTEGDPVALGRKRSRTFWNRKSIEVSTPTIKGASRIETSYQQSNQQEFYLPCPHCLQPFLLRWKNVHWDKSEDPETGEKKHLYKTAYMKCPDCHGVINNEHKKDMLAAGEWVAHNPDNDIQGFWINELYSPWSSFADVVEAFLEAKKVPEMLKVWTNTSLAETWEEESEQLDDNVLFSRREVYEQDIPDGVLCITCGVDVQRDRLELEFVGWGDNFESWGIEYKIISGDPKMPETWEALTYELRKDFIKIIDDRPVIMNIVGAFVDSGDGENTQIVYDYCHGRPVHNIYPIKGVDGHNRAIVDQRELIGYPIRRKMISIGVDSAKNLLFTYLMQGTPGPGYCHFPIEYDHEYFNQLTAEKVSLKPHKGFFRRVWEKTRPRNESWDIRVMNLAFIKLYQPNFEMLRNRLLRSIDEKREVTKKSVASKKRNNSFLNIKHDWRI